MSNIKKTLANESSIAAYCLIMVLYCFNNLGVTQTFWIYFALMSLFSSVYWYRIYSSDEKNKTYTFFQLDYLAMGLFLITVYFDSKYGFVNFELNSIAIYILIIGLILIFTDVFKYFFSKEKK